MRQLLPVFLSLGALAAWGQNAPDTPEIAANKRIAQAQQELQKLNELVTAGAVSKLRVEQAQQDLADLQDDAVLARTLYGDLPVENLNDALTDEMVAAAQRRV